MAINSPVIQMAGVRAVAFDLDDTLFDRQAALALLLERWMGADEASRALAEVVLRDGHGHRPRREFFAWLAARHPVAGPCGAQVETRFRQDFPRCIAQDAAAATLLSRLLEAGVELALVSNGNASFQMAKLRACGMASFFSRDRLLFSSALGFAKPDPRVYDLLIRKLGMPPEAILFAGDDPQCDIAGARAAGLRTCLVKRPGRLTDASGADITLSSLADLLEIPGLFSR